MYYYSCVWLLADWLYWFVYYAWFWYLCVIIVCCVLVCFVWICYLVDGLNWFKCLGGGLCWDFIAVVVLILRCLGVLLWIILLYCDCLYLWFYCGFFCVFLIVLMFLTYSLTLGWWLFDLVWNVLFYCCSDYTCDFWVFGVWLFLEWFYSNSCDCFTIGCLCVCLLCWFC